MEIIIWRVYFLMYHATIIVFYRGHGFTTNPMLQMCMREGTDLEMKLKMIILSMNVSQPISTISTHSMSHLKMPAVIILFTTFNGASIYLGGLPIIFKPVALIPTNIIPC